MKFKITKKLLEEALRKSCVVCTKGIKTEFTDAHKITIRAEKDKVLFLSTNGYLDVLTIYSKSQGGCEVENEGVASINASVGRNIAQAIGNDDDDEIELSIKTLSGSPHLHLKNLTVKKKKVAKMQTEAQDLKFTIPKPKKGKNYLEHLFPRKLFCDSVNSLVKYKSPFQFKPKYLMLCIHFLPDHIRFICGCGMRFGCLEYKNKETFEGLVDPEKGDKRLLPAEQASIIASVVGNEGDLGLHWNDYKTCLIDAGSTQLCLKGIPEEEYISYEIHAYRFKDAKAVVDIRRDKMAHLARLAGAVRDKDSESEGSFHTCCLSVKESEISVEVDEGKYQMEAEEDIEFYKVSASEFKANYSHEFVSDSIEDTNYDTVRFYCIDPDGIVIVEPLILDVKDGTFVEDERVPEAHCPRRKVEDDYAANMIFFFTAAGDE